MKSFELSVLIALINGYDDCLNVTPEEKLEVVSHIHGHEVGMYDYDAINAAIEHIVNTQPKVAEAAQLTSRVVPDMARYNKLIDMFRKVHEIGSLELAEA